MGKKHKKGKTGYKPWIFQAAFDERWNSTTGDLSDPVVTLTEIGRRINEYNASVAVGDRVSDRNPANFYKDFIRVVRRANVNFPASIFQRGYTARQATGENRCFRFVKVKASAVRYCR